MEVDPWEDAFQAHWTPDNDPELLICMITDEKLMRSRLNFDNPLSMGSGAWRLSAFKGFYHIRLWSKINAITCH